MSARDEAIEVASREAALCETGDDAREVARKLLDAAHEAGHILYRDEVHAAIAKIREHYNESIFPPIETGMNAPPRPPDAFAAAGARLACDNILHELRRVVPSFTQEGHE